MRINISVQAFILFSFRLKEALKKMIIKVLLNLA